MRNVLELAPPRAVRAAANIPLARRSIERGFASMPLFQRTDAALQLEAYATMSTVYAIVRRRASDVARQRWGIFRGPEMVNGTEREQLETHALLNLWRRPNPTQAKTGRALRQLATTHLELLGEACLHIVRAGTSPTAQPIELWVVNPQELTPVTDPHNWQIGWEHQSVDGERTPLRMSDILQIKYPDPNNPYRGLSPVAAAMTHIESGRLASAWQRNFFLNSAVPGGIVTTSEPMTDAEWTEWVDRWNLQHGGVNNAHRVALMDSDTKWMSTSMSMRDMEFVEMMAASRELIWEAFGMSKTLLGLAEDVNRASAEAAEYVYGRYSLADPVDLWTEAGNELLDNYGSASRGRLRLEFDLVSELVPADAEAANADRDSRFSAAASMIAAGADPASALDALGLPDIEWTAEPEPDTEGMDAAQQAMAVAQAVADGPGDAQAVLDAVQAVQRIYLGVDTVLLWSEARAILNLLLTPLGVPLADVEDPKVPNELTASTSDDDLPDPNEDTDGDGVADVEQGDTGDNDAADALAAARQDAAEDG